MAHRPHGIESKRSDRKIKGYEPYILKNGTLFRFVHLWYMVLGEDFPSQYSTYPSQARKRHCGPKVLTAMSRNRVSVGLRKITLRTLFLHREPGQQRAISHHCKLQLIRGSFPSLAQQGPQANVEITQENTSIVRLQR
jgi:hypothetical protein